jgi:predicted ATPase
MQSRYISFEQLKLKPFTTSQVRQLLEAIFTHIEISENALLRLYQLTNGNPYYLIEVIRLLVQDNKIVLGEGWWHGETLEDLELPTTIAIALQHKLQSCDEQVYTLLQQAAILGNSFRFDILLLMTAKDETTIEEQLTTATKAFLIREEQGSQAEDYRFCNTIIRQMLYDALSKRQRRRLHARAATATQEIYAHKLPRVYGILAYHFNAAALWPEAFEFATKAVEQAWKNEAWDEVDKYAQWVEEAVAGLKEISHQHPLLNLVLLMETKLKHASALMRAGHKINQAGQQADSALAIATKLNHGQFIARSKDILCELYWYQARFSEAIKLADEGLEAAQVANDERAKRLLHYHRGWVSWRSVPFAEALSHLRQACELAEMHQDSKLLAQARSFYGIVHHCQGAWREGTAYIRQGLELTRQLGDRRAESLICSLLMVTAYYQREHERLLELYENGLQVVRAVGWRIGEAYFHLLLGFDYLSPTNLQINQAWNFLQRGLAICQETGEKGFQLLATRGLAKVSTLIGESTQAIMRLQEMLSLLQRTGDLFEQVSTLCFLADAQETAGQIDAALASFTACQELSARLPFPIWQWQALYGEARCLDQLGNRALAIAKLDEACAIITKLRNGFETPKAASNFMQETEIVYQCLLDWQ